MLSDFDEKWIFFHCSIIIRRNSINDLQLDLYMISKNKIVLDLGLALNDRRDLIVILYQSFILRQKTVGGTKQRKVQILTWKSI
jgi:hypothetical protein